MANNDNDLEDYIEEPILPVNNDEKVSESCISKSFKDLGLSEILLENITNAQFENPSPVQIKAIPKILLGYDVLCQAKSGTGKTAVFVLSTLEEIYRDSETKIAVCVHNEDLSQQIYGEYLRFSKNMQVEIKNLNFDYQRLITKYGKQDQPAVIVGTLQKFRESSCKFDIIVVDECDFVVLQKENYIMLRSFINKCGKTQNSILMFTATLTEETKRLCLGFMVNACEIYVDHESQLSLHGLRQHYIETKDKIETLKSLDYSRPTIIFTSCVEAARQVEKCLGVECSVITNYNTSRERIDILRDFKNKKFKVLSTTDILSRGIDIQDVEMVINYDMPDNPQTYLHRVGRAGRFESGGDAISFISTREDIIRLNEIMFKYEIDIVPLKKTK